MISKDKLIAIHQLLIHHPEIFKNTYKYLSDDEKKVVKDFLFSKPKLVNVVFLLGLQSDAKSEYIFNSLRYDPLFLMVDEDIVSEYDNETGESVITYQKKEKIRLNEDIVIKISQKYPRVIMYHPIIAKNKATKTIMTDSHIKSIKPGWLSLNEKARHSIIELIRNYPHLLNQYKHYDERMQEMLFSHVLYESSINTEFAKDVKLDPTIYGSVNDIISYYIYSKNYTKVSQYLGSGAIFNDFLKGIVCQTKTSFPISFLECYDKINQKMLDDSIFETKNIGSNDLYFKNIKKGYQEKNAFNSLKRHIFIEYNPNQYYSIIKERIDFVKDGYANRKNYDLEVKCLKMDIDKVLKILEKNSLKTPQNVAKILDLFFTLIGKEYIQVNIDKDLWLELLKINYDYLFLIPHDLIDHTVFKAVMDYGRKKEKRNIQMSKNLWLKTSKKVSNYKSFFYYNILLNDLDHDKFVRAKMDQSISRFIDDEAHWENDDNLMNKIYENKEFLKFYIDDNFSNVFNFAYRKGFNIDNYELVNNGLSHQVWLSEYISEMQIKFDMHSYNMKLVKKYPNYIRHIKKPNDEVVLTAMNGAVHHFKNLTQKAKDQYVLRYTKAFIKKCLSNKEEHDDIVQDMDSIRSFSSIVKNGVDKTLILRLIKSEKLKIETCMDHVVKNEPQVISSEALHYVLMDILIHKGATSFINDKNIEIAQDVMDRYFKSEIPDHSQIIFKIKNNNFINTKTLSYLFQNHAYKDKELLKAITHHPNFMHISFLVDIMENI